MFIEITQLFQNVVDSTQHFKLYVILLTNPVNTSNSSSSSIYSVKRRLHWPHLYVKLKVSKCGATITIIYETISQWLYAALTRRFHITERFEFETSRVN